MKVEVENIMQGLETLKYSDISDEVWNQLAEAENKQQAKEIFLDIVDPDCVFRNGYGVYGFEMNEDRTVRIKLGTSCD
jgi:hypothetical protein